MYAFTLLADRWWVMLIGRAVAGAGSPVLVLGSAYISQVGWARRKPWGQPASVVCRGARVAGRHRELGVAVSERCRCMCPPCGGFRL